MKPQVTLAAFVCLSALRLLAQEERPAAELLERVDRTLRPSKSFTVTIEATTYKDRSAVGSITVHALVRVPATTAPPDLLATLTAPESERGKMYLRKTDGLWFYDPKAKRPVRISAQQRLYGQASLDDFMSTDLRSDYAPKLEADETVNDSAGQARSCQKLRLTALRKSAPYAAITLWVDRDNHQAVKATCFAAAGRPLRTVYYGKFRGFLGSARPTEVQLVDEVRPGTVTQLRFSDFDERDMPEAWFDPAQLPQTQQALSK
ncbi:MAG: outer membrane lipoprotein-sorting protein [Roseimicrobium sp.]